MNFLVDETFCPQKLSSWQTQTEAELLKVKIIIRKYILKPLINKNIGKNC